MQSEHLTTSLEALFYIYSQLDTNLGILNTLFPNKEIFFEDNVKNINYSFLKFLDNNKEIEESNKTSLNSKFNNKLYTSIYDIFHDIKLSCIIKILEFEDNPQLYLKIDQFYKISIELLLREAIRLGVTFNTISNNNNNNSNNKDIENENKTEEEKIKEKENQMLSQLKLIESTDGLAKTLEKDFDIITSSFYSNTGKSLSLFASGNIPFFTSLNNFKSDLDDREPIIDPSFGITINNIIPNISQFNNETLSKFLNPDSKIPNIRQILENYMHPNWLRLISSQWLKHGDNLTSLNFSFAPTFDETQSIISNDWKGLTWCQQIGFKKLIDLKQKYDNSINKLKIESLKDETLKNNNSDSTKDIETNNSIQKDDKESSIEKNNKEIEEEKNKIDVNKFDEKYKIDLSNIFQWNYNDVISELEVKCVESNNVQSTISDLLNELSQLRQDRIESQKKHARYNKNVLGTGSRIFKPSNDETKLYFKIKRLLTGLIEAKNINPNQLNISIDKRIPVLQHVSQGTLPASFAVSSSKTSKSKRRK